MTASRIAHIALALCLGTPLAAQAPPLVTYRTKTLDNGLEVIVASNRSIPFTSLQIAFRGGAFIQTSRDLDGLPHMLEHMLFQRTESAFSKTVIERMAELDVIGDNATTSDETVTYFYTVPSKNSMAGIQLLSDMVRRPNFDQRAVQAEARAVRGELQRVASEPNLLLLTTADRQLWTDAGWERKNPGGNLLSIQDASVDRLRGLHARYYVPNNAVLIVAGDVNADSAFRVIEQAFGNWRRAADPMVGTPPLEIPPLAAISREYVTATVRDVTFLVRWHGPSVGTDRAGSYAASLFSSAVNQPLSGTQRRLIETGLFQAVTMEYLPRRFVGPISIFARTTPERAVAAASALGQELRRLTAADYISEEDVSFARKRQRVFDAFAEETSMGLASVIAYGWAAADLQYVLTESDSVKARTGADLQRFVDSYLKGKNFAVTVLLSTEAQAEIGARLRTSLNAWRIP